jgi:hypothetical protein
MNKCALDNPTLKDVEVKHRDILKKSIDKLSKTFTKDEWSLTVYLKESEQYKWFGKYVIMYWDDPYTLKVTIESNDTYKFEICDSTWDTTVLERRVSFDNFHLGEFDFFINSVKDFFAIKDKLRKFTSDYNTQQLPEGYKRNDKLEQLLS